MPSFLPLALFTFTLFSTSFYTINGVFIERVSETKQVSRAEQTTHLHFYFHDILSGNNPTAIQVITGPPKASSTGLFGSLSMIDDALTEEKDPTSKSVGRAQGFYAVASQSELAFLMVMNLVFEEGKYKGSSISVVGRNPVMNDVREMSIVGGSGVFRGAHGYILAHTVSLDASGDAIVEYNVYVTNDSSSSSSSPTTTTTPSTTSSTTPFSSSSSSSCKVINAFLLILICFCLFFLGF
ncbi:hypothetical protein UlMin_007460 [Ulmus minor]